MKKGNDFIVLKYVYRSIDGVFYRDDPFSCSADYFPLSGDFPCIDLIAVNFPLFRVRFVKGNQEITAWKDKHHNVIVRIIDKSYLQTRLKL